MKFIKISEQYSSLGEKVDCFYSFFLMDEKLYSVHRRHMLFSFDNWPKKKSDYQSQIVLTEYMGKNPNKIISEEVICDGNDPRVVSDGNNAYILSEGSLYSEDVYILTILPKKYSISVTLGASVKQGKNWQPVLVNNELFVIDSMSPLKMNKLDINTGIITKVKEQDTDFNLKAVHDNYAILRGGTNGITINNKVFGWGHATVRSYSHIPYIWEYGENGLTSSFTNIHSVFKTNGYNIVDPASFFKWDENHLALSLSCSQRDWFHPQWFLNVLLLIKENDFLNKTIQLKAIEEGLQPLEDVLTTKSIFFHSTEMDSLINSSHINGGRCNNGFKGCLVCGPSQEIDLTKSWNIELCYSSPNKTSQYVGDFDIFLTIDGVDKSVAITKIYGTNGKSIRVSLEIAPVSEYDKALIQTRIFTRKRKYVTAYFFELTDE